MRRLTDIIWSGPAERDLVEILEFYSAIDEELADRLAGLILQEPLRLLEFPLIGPPVGARDFRKWQVRGTPFLLLYAYRGGHIEIRRVRHSREEWRPEP